VAGSAATRGASTPSACCSATSRATPPPPRNEPASIAPHMSGGLTPVRG
jgi:hypothetical protein